LTFFVALVIDGALAGAVYALIALAFVVVYKASRMINFALGEWAMFGSRLAATGWHVLELGLAGALVSAGVGMVALAVAFNRVVLRRLVGRPLLSLIMVTIGLGALMRGIAGPTFAQVPGAIPLPFSPDPFTVHGIFIAPDRVLAAGVALGAIAAVTGFFHWSRTGVALRAIADDQQAAMAVGIDVSRHFSVTWAMVGVISVLAGVLWSFVSGGGPSLVLIGLKVFPIVILGGLDSIPGTFVAAILIGVLESLVAGYLDSSLGGGFSSVASYLVLIAVLCVRPYGLFGRPLVERV
jgi:branched-chain amino acid transport system permease protein